MKLASYDHNNHGPKVNGRILSASRAVLKTHLKKYIIITSHIPFRFYDNFINYESETKAGKNILTNKFE